MSFSQNLEKVVKNYKSRPQFPEACGALKVAVHSGETLGGVAFAKEH